MSLPPEPNPDAPPAAPIGPPARGPLVGVLVDRARGMAQDLAPVEALRRRLEALGADVLSIPCDGPEDDPDREAGGDSPVGLFPDDEAGRCRVDVLISTVGLAFDRATDGTSAEAADAAVGWLGRLDVPVLQAVLCTASQAEWDASPAGLPPRDLTSNVVLPEFDGRIQTVAISFEEGGEPDDHRGAAVKRSFPLPDRIDRVARLALNYARLRRTGAADRRIAIFLGNDPPGAARIGDGGGLDTPESIMNLLRALEAAGYDVGHDLPADGDDLMHRLIDRCTNDEDSPTDDQLRDAVGHVSLATYERWFDQLPDDPRRAMIEHWGLPLGTVGRIDDQLAITGLVFGNVFLGIQPPRSFGANPSAIYHGPDLPPTHHHLASYRWLQHDFGAQAVIHIGRQSNLEWLPGKATALSEECYPEIILAEMPNFRLCSINDPGAGTQAKRRAHAVIIDHLIPPMAKAGTDGDLARLAELIDEFDRTATLDPSHLPDLTRRIWTLVARNHLDRDLKVDDCPEAAHFGRFLRQLDGYLSELGDAPIRDGLHVFGRPPEGERRVGLIQAMMRLDNGAIPSIRKAFAAEWSIDYDPTPGRPGAPLDEPIDPRTRRFLRNHDAALGRPGGEKATWTRADLSEALDDAVRVRIDREVHRVEHHRSPDVPVHPDAAASITFVRNEIIPGLDQTTDELTNLLRGLAGRFVPAGPSGAPTRGMARILPTGRNLFGVDPRTIPTEAARGVGARAGDRLIERYLQQYGGQYPPSVGFVARGTSTMRTGGDDIAEILHLIGVRPIRAPGGGRLQGVELVPPAELGRPRIDVVVRISGGFRDAFPHVIALIDRAVELVAAADEGDDRNFVRRHVRRDEQAMIASGVEGDQARARARYRIFGPEPGYDGAGLLDLIDERNWQADADLAEVFIGGGSHAYTQSEHGVAASGAFRRRLGQVAVAVLNGDNREHDLFDSDDDFPSLGGMIAAIRALTGEGPAAYFGDTSDPDHVRVRDLADEARRVFRSRVVDPSWIAGVMRHGFGGASEMAATVDRLFGYEATAGVVDDWMFEDVSKSYLFNGTVLGFLRASNPWALRSMAERLLEAIDRGLWERPDPATVHLLRAIHRCPEGDS